MIKKWYFAAQFSRLTEIASYATRARIANLEVTSHWLEQDASLGYAGGSSEAGRIFAERDLVDIAAADGFLFFAEDPAIGIPRGGRLVEMGYALALDKTVEIIGSAENVFHLLPGLMHYPTFEVWLETKKAEVM